MKIRPLGAEWFDADGRTDTRGHDEANSLSLSLFFLSIFADARSNQSVNAVVTICT
jgi:hypothetical protein